MFFPKTFAKEISHVAEDNEDEVRDVCCQDVIVRRLIHDRFCKVSGLMLADISMGLRIERSKLSMLFVKAPGFCR